MNYQFQSLKDRNADIGDKIRVRDYFFQTSDEALAETMRNNCKKNPSLYIEITPEVLLGKPKEEQVVVEKAIEAVKEKKVKVKQGMRLSQE